MVDSRKDFFWGPHFHFFGGSGRLFFVGCDVFQKLRIISKIADHAFEMVMTIDLILQWGLFSPRMIRNFCKTQDEPRGWEKNGFWRGKTHRISPKNFLRPRDTYKKYILQKNWVKTVIPAFSSGQSNLPPLYMGSQPPTRWSTQKYKYEEQRSSRWAIN